MTFEEVTFKALPIAVEFIGMGATVSIDVNQYGGTPNAIVNVHANDKSRIPIFRRVLALCGGKIEKGNPACHGKVDENITITLFDALTCKIVGYEKRPKREYVETEEMIEVPIYDCHVPSLNS